MGSDWSKRSGKRAMVVEDDALVALVLSEYLDDLGIVTVGAYRDLNQAPAAAISEPLDFALLDVVIRGDLVFPVADALSVRGIPYAFMTGRDAEDLPEKYQYAVCIQKPYTFGHIEQFLNSQFHELGKSLDSGGPSGTVCTTAA